MPLLSSSSPPVRRNQSRKGQQILNPKPGPAAAHCEVGICGNRIGPTDRHGKQGSVRQLNRHPVLAPEHLGDDEPKGQPAERMEGMGNPNLLWIDRIMCS